ncbi:hypothetical protein OG417_45340 [Actinoallomurus sp. NBC_01490]|uniref:competence protein CoiA family protein n=1 Tax=Actinoallomurus sp. NBC_01490 TaxID=2903557 RepID=UPI002E300BC5|nr:hypothetical protein [Actinoallomurus sp. NBC_01490]
MTHTVFHRGYGIELNLTEDDLGHPDRPGLLDELYQNYKPDLLYCVDAYDHGGVACPGFMTIRKVSGRAHAMHVNIGELKETEGESDLHKALKEYTARTADREGFATRIEDRPRHGRRRTDVIVQGANGRELGYEIQLSAIATGSVDSRTRIARTDGLTPLWLVNDENAIPIDRAPWARLNVFSWKDVGRREALPVRGGVKTLRLASCDWNSPEPCPKQGRGRCGGRHGVWVATTGLYYDDVIYRTAVGELVPLYYERSDGRRGWHMWVTPTDKEEFLQGRPEPSPDAARARAVARENRPLVPKARDPECHYGQDTGIRAELARPRDSGDPIDAADWMSEPPSPQFTATQEVDGFRIPGDLIAAQRAYYMAEARCEQIFSAHPRPTDIAAGRAEITDEQRVELAAARGERLRLVEALNDHPWWATVDNRLRAKQALRTAAQK